MTPTRDGARPDAGAVDGVSRCKRLSVPESEDLSRYGPYASGPRAARREEPRIGGTIVPDTAKEKPQQARVIAVGTGRTSDNGKTIPLDVKIGDSVLIGKYSGTDIKLDGEDYLIVREEEIVGVAEGVPQLAIVWAAGYRRQADRIHAQAPVQPAMDHYQSTRRRTRLSDVWSIEDECASLAAHPSAW